jgi:hypothetical protein
LIEAVLLTSASLVAVIVSVPVVAGAVYAPEELICPSVAVHVTDLSVAVPVTVTESCRVPAAMAVAAFGVMTIEVIADPLSPLPWVGLGLEPAGLPERLEALVGFVLATEPAQPPVPNEAPRTREVTAKLVVQTAFLKAQIMERRDSLSI